jgi:hypothetical protein
MKVAFSILAIFFVIHGFAQSPAEAEILKLSNDVFTWEVDNKIDSLEGLLSEKFKVVTSRGDIQTKEPYLTTLRSGNVKHDSIVIEQTIAAIEDKTAIVIGKGWFYMTVSGNKLHRHLSYMEVFVKEYSVWKLIALYASALPE